MFRQILFSLVACAVTVARAHLAWPLLYPYSAPYPMPYLPITSSRYHAQDELGQFNFGYTGNNQYRTESRMLDGSVHGSYSYVDPTNKIVRVVYVADESGFRIVEGNNLPTVPAELPLPQMPQPVDYTPEVAAARAEFEKNYNALAAQAAKEAATDGEEELDSKPTTTRKKRSAFIPALFAINPTTVKVKITEGEEVKNVISPANTKPVEYKEVEKTLAFPPMVVARSRGPIVQLQPPHWPWYISL